MGYDTKGIRLLDLGEAGIFLVIDHVRGGSRGDVLGGYDSRSNIFGSERPGSPGKTQTDEGGVGGAKMNGRRGGGAPQGLCDGPSRSHHCSQTPAYCIL